MTVAVVQRIAALIWLTGSKGARLNDHQVTVAEKRAFRGAA